MTPLVNQFLEAISQAKNAGQWGTCIEKCNEALSELKGLDVESRYAISINLALCLLNRGSPNDIETAIRIYEELLSTLEPTDTRRNHLDMYLGYAFHGRKLGDRTRNLLVAIEHYCSAFTVYAKDKDPLMWASLSAEIGKALGEVGTDEAMKEAGTRLRDARDVFHLHDCLDEVIELEAALFDLGQC